MERLSQSSFRRLLLSYVTVLNDMAPLPVPTDDDIHSDVVPSNIVSRQLRLYNDCSEKLVA